ncbi:MAG: energy-coupling factor ABC transporter ATP-binding protein [Desulfovibrionaceae bacterium]
MNLAYELAGVSQWYEGREVLRIDRLEIQERAILGLVGPNGSGKSTLLRILAFLEAPVAGEVRYKGKAASVADAALRREITLLTQEPYLLKRSVSDNVAYGLRVRGRTRSNGLVADALALVGLDPIRYGQRPWYALSGGEAQRVALAARLVLRPQVLLLDEPTANLDRESTARIREAALAAREQWGATLVLVSHDMTWLESMADSAVRMEDGCLSPV